MRKSIHHQHNGAFMDEITLSVHRYYEILVIASIPEHLMLFNLLVLLPVSPQKLRHLSAWRLV